MPVAVFDIDGTLTDTNDVDIECYEAAVRLELGVEIPTDWPSFDEVTDSAILSVACERQGSPLPDRQTEERIALRVAELLGLELTEAPERFRAVPGAAEVFGVLGRAGWSVAMATGAWRPSALVKLKGAGVPHQGVPLASSSDHPTRAEIIRHAVRALPEDTVGPVVYIGDGVWDGRAARALGHAFIGVGQGPRAGELSEAGAVVVVPDFRNAVFLVDQLNRLEAEARNQL